MESEVKVALPKELRKLGFVFVGSEKQQSSLFFYFFGKTTEHVDYET